VSVQSGIWNFDGQPVDSRLLDDFSESLTWQGPDGVSSYVNGSIALQYRPFHTTAESRRERQPHFSHRGFVLTWDGRLDNREELISELRDDLETKPTDVAIVSAAFDRWETDCFPRIVGDWAVSIWKPQQQELLFAIDYIAIRHIFYYLKQYGVWWSTNLSPLVLLSGDKFHIDDDYVAGYFAHDPDADLTPYREIHEVPPGQFVRVRNGKATVDRYWRFSPASRVRYKTDSEYEEHFRHVFRQSVRRRLRADSPILAELSGGLDSSSIVCMADDILHKELAHGPRLDTLSFYDKTEPHGDDSLYFPEVEKKRGRAGIHIDASKLGISPRSFEYTEFEPLPGYLGSGRELEGERAAVVRDGGYRAVLSGIGGDELLGGIPNPSSQLADLIIQFRLPTLARQLCAWSLVKRKTLLSLLARASMELLPPWLAQYFVKQAKVDPWIEKPFARRTRFPVRLLDVEEHFGLRLPSRRSYIAGVLLMANKLSKRTSSALALEEGRYPYLDQNLVEYLLSIPADQLLRPGERRSLMRRSLGELLPDAIRSRKTKQTGSRTLIVAADKQLGQLQTLFRSSLSSRFGYVNDAQFLRKLVAAKHGKDIPIVTLLRTISLEIWLRNLAARDLIATPTMSRASAPPVSMEARV
jgi:asparagine synthase (glutamine-hydrolysing)